MEQKNERAQEAAVQGPVQQAIRNRLEEGRASSKGWKRSVLIIIAAVVMVFLLVYVFFGIAVVAGDSMQPTYAEGDFVIFSRTADEFERGDVVLVRTEDGQEVIKRIIAVPEETLYIDTRTGSVFVNGKELQENYTQGRTDREDSVDYPVRLQENEYFVLGDNRDHSFDSREYGPVTSEQIMGKVLITFRRNN